MAYVLLRHKNQRMMFYSALRKFQTHKNILKIINESINI